MGVSVYFRAIEEPTEDYLLKKRAYDTCREAGITPPQELLDLFDEEDVLTERGREFSLYGHPAISGRVESGDGAVIDLSQLPSEVTRIRVYMS